MSLVARQRCEVQRAQYISEIMEFNPFLLKKWDQAVAILYINMSTVFKVSHQFAVQDVISY